MNDFALKIGNEVVVEGKRDGIGGALEKLDHFSRRRQPR